MVNNQPLPEQLTQGLLGGTTPSGHYGSHSSEREWQRRKEQWLSIEASNGHSGGGEQWALGFETIWTMGDEEDKRKGKESSWGFNLDPVFQIQI